MSKSNDKQHRTRGVTISKNIEFPDPVTTKNNPSGTLTNSKDRDAIERESVQNNKY